MERIKILVAKSDNLKCVYRACMIEGENQFSYLYTSVMTHVYVYMHTYIYVYMHTRRHTHPYKIYK